MTSASKPPRRWFSYNASALALGGRITRPFCDVIEPQAAAVLPIVGGHGHARVENFRYRDLVSFRSATATVSGSPSGDPDRPLYNTLASIVIEGLDIAGVVTADRIVARLVSEHDGDDRDLPILPVGTRFENLCVAGVQIQPRPQPALFDCATVRELGEWSKKGSTGPLDARGATLAAPSEGGRALTALYQRPEAFAGYEDGATWGIAVRGFGVVYLGELLIAAGERRLTMIRIEMGSPIGGSLALGYVGGNGTTHP